MKIAFFLDQSFPPDSRVENEAYSLVRAGHQVDLFSLNFKELKPKEEEINGIRVHRIDASDFLYRLSALAYDLPIFHWLLHSKIKAFIEKVKPEALHVHDMLIAKAVMDINDRFFQLPLTLDLHENRPEILQFYPHLQRFPGKYMINIERWRSAQTSLIQRADHVVLVTPEAIDDAMAASGRERSSFTAVANTIEPEIYFNYPLDDRITENLKGYFNIVYVGDTGIRRGLDTAIAAMKKVLKVVPNAQLVVVGKSTQDEQLRQMVSSKGLEENVLFEGWQDVSLFPSYIESASVCISPLHRNKHHDTTFANKIFQYMAGTKPLIVSDCPSQENVVKEVGCGLVFKAKDAEDLANCILKIYHNPEEAKQMGEAGKHAVIEKYNWNETSKGLLELYD
ncbi:hypothetical protein BFP97_01930 [Roseivirga sp. 4D4]|uniref:glycosyltransferase family 4 protein n=1 Tax=Roseivirga sp. 4D4 TaxID=1889784 RepID=UPI000853888B|nr:glycosyltransferase family 4 protein [Roseivirga sp. 4D4]OEK00345.1 hypothetical protein BFP97_01930 [Roseivirga sp. 4D4]